MPILVVAQPGLAVPADVDRRRRRGDRRHRSV